MAVADSTEEQLAWEGQQRPRAAVAAILAGVLTLGANIWSAIGFRGQPHAGFLESLQNVAKPGPVGPTTSLRAARFQFVHDHATVVVGTAVMTAIGMVALGWAVSYLAAATRARRPEMVRFAAYLPVVGAVLAGVAAVVGAIAAESAYSSFLSGPHTVDAAAKIGSNSLLIAASFLSFIGGFLLGGGLVLVCLNAMRAGLLTRFMGVLGIIVGVLEALPFFGALPIAEPLWLLALGAVYLGLTPTGLPPAWRTGKAEPWPTQAELAQQRQAAAAARRGGTPAAEPPQPERRPAPVGGSAKRKRKRRR